MNRPTGDPNEASVDVAAVLGDVRALYLRGQYLDALAAGEPLGPPEHWPGPEGQVLAGRLVSQLGGGRWATATHLRTARNHPEHAEAQYYGLFATLSTRGPWSAWHHVRRVGIDLTGDGVSDRVRADWWAAQARVLSAMRDFVPAEALLQRALDLCPDEPWLRVEQGSLLGAMDRNEESLEVTAAAYTAYPQSRPVLQSYAHDLMILDRADEAVAVLESACPRFQCGALWWQLAGLYREFENTTAMADALDAAEALLPRIDKGQKAGIAALRVEALRAAGDLAGAAEAARNAKGKHFERLAELYGKPDVDTRRARLNVPFVRQHHVTCAPATLSALCRYWNQPFDHLEIAEKICYDGTPWRSERAWAEQRGFVVREFRIDFETAAALLDRGVPFTLTTASAASGHLQAVIGYDRAAHTLDIRDPYYPHVGTAITERLCERQRAAGPRGMVLLPPSEAHLLDGIDLPDEAFYDDYYAVQTALERHDREAAVTHAAELAQRDDNHFLRHWADLSLAWYDGDPARALAALDRLLALCPDDSGLIDRRASTLTQLHRRQETIALLEAELDKPEADRAFREQLIDLLADDPRQRDRALRMAEALLRRGGGRGYLYYTLGRLLWPDRERRDEAVAAYRFASCLDDKNERFSQAYFVCQQHQRKTDEALEDLRRRAETLGNKSAGPILTYADALRRCDRLGEEAQALEAGIERRPDDGVLLLESAVKHAGGGRIDRARALLHQSRRAVRRTDRLRAGSIVEELDGQLPRALRLVRRWAILDPLSLEAHSRTARLTADVEGAPAATDYLASVTARFPHHLPLHELRYQWTQEHDEQDAEQLLRQIVERQPDNDWALRELAFRVLETGQLDEAEALLARAHEINPEHAATFHLRAAVDERRGDLDAARASMRVALQRDADNQFAMGRLMSLCRDLAQRVEAAGFIAKQLEEQTLFGTGITAFQSLAANVLPPDEVLRIVTECRDARPDLSTSWLALVRELTRQNRLDEAKDEVQRALSRFPLVVDLHLGAATVYHASLDQDARVSSLREALRIDPFHEMAIRTLVDALRHGRQFDASLAELDRAIRVDPRRGAYHGLRAELLADTGDFRGAVLSAETALRLMPGWDWLWDRYDEWGKKLDPPRDAEPLARQIAETKPGDIDLQLRLAEILVRRGGSDEALDTLDNAIERSPHTPRVHDHKAVTLTLLHRYDEALRACRPEVFGKDVPPVLRGRAAWITAQRGDLKHAVQEMRKVLDDEPGYYWGWQRLAEWASNDEDLPTYQHAAEQLAVLAPHDAESICYAGHACERLAEEPGRRPKSEREALRRRAIEHYERAVALDPHFRWAGRGLIRVHLLLNEPDQAERACDHFYQDDPTAEAKAAPVQIAAARRDKAQTLEAIAALVAAPSDEAAPFYWAADALSRLWARTERAAIRAWRSAVVKADSNPFAVAALVNRLTSTGRWRKATEVLRAVRDRDEHWRQGAIALLETGTHQTATRAKAARWVKRNRARLQQDRGGASSHAAWGAAADVLAVQGQYAPMAKLVADWRQRPDSEAWVFCMAAIAFHAVGRPDEALEVSDAGLRAPADHSRSRLCVWHALALALLEEPGRADDVLDLVSDDALRDFDHYFYDLTLAAIAAQDDVPDRQAWAQANRHWDAARKRVRTWRSHDLHRRVTNRVLRLLVRRRPGITGHLARLLAPMQYRG